MSIEYFVEGEVKYDFKGDFKIFSKENITNNAAQEVRQKGVESGVSYNKPQTIDENDTPSETIDVSLNLFFDGTQNNKTNTESRITNNKTYNNKSNKDDDSYMNDYSNIARGYDAVNPDADKQVKVYIEGIGTVDGDRDTLDWIPSLPNNIAGGLGEGLRGVKAKVAKGCIESAKALQKKFKKKKINILKVNVFGFSRGATAARHFIHVATTSTGYLRKRMKLNIYPPSYYELSEQEELNSNILDQVIQLDATEDYEKFIDLYGYFGACLINKNLKINKIEFNFVGLYDTVASFGINHRGLTIFGKDIIDNDSKQLNLDAVKHANFCLHITSDDEYRENFSLTNINSTGLHGLEFTLPGVHSDIGGSYVEGEKEERTLYKGSKEDCEKMKKILEEEGWYVNGQLKIIIKSNARDDRQWYELRGVRTLSNQYDKIALQQMFHYSKQKSFDVKYLTDKLEDKYSITNPEIQTVYEYLSFYMNKCNNIRNDYVINSQKGLAVSNNQYINDIKQISYLNYLPIEVLKNLRNKYLHWSVSDKFGMGANVSGIKTFDQRKRYIMHG